MTTNIQLLRSSVAQKRPSPASLLEGQPAVNINVAEPGLFFKGSDGTLFKVGPVAITSTGSAPNSAASGPSGNLPGETWLDGRNTFSNPILKVYDGTGWRAANGFSVNDSTGNFSLAKTLTISTLIANGTGANSFVRLPNGPSGDEGLIPAAAGMVRFDTTLNQFRGYNGTQWTDLSSGTLTDLIVSGNAFVGGTLTVNGNVTLGNDCTIDTVTINAATNIACNATVGVNATNVLTVSASTTFASPTRHVNQQPIRFFSGTVAGSNYVALRAPSNIPANLTWTLPAVDGSSGQILTTNGAGQLNWVSTPPISAAGSDTQVQFNSGGQLAGSLNMTFDGTTLTVKGLTVGATTSDLVVFNARVNSNLLPSTDNARDLGSPANRWANIYTGDLHLANERGDWTVIEESDYLSLRNNKNGKVFRLLMKEVES
jgi:hypothetical protein